MSPKALNKTTKVLKALTKKTEHLRAHVRPAIALCDHPDRHIIALASNRHHGYRSLVAANSATGFGDPTNSRRTGAPISVAGAFFVPARPVYGGCAWETFGSAGFLDSRFANLRTAATPIRLATIRGSSTNQGATPMIHTLNPSRIPVELQKAYCTQLLKVLLRYSSQAELSRAIATIESEVTTTLSARFVPGLNDASYDVYRRFWLKGGDV